MELWYDTLDALATTIKLHPKDALVPEDFLSLLNPVGVGDVATQECQRFSQK